MIVRLAAGSPATVEGGDVLTELAVFRPASMSAEQLAAATDDLVAEINGDHAWIVLSELEEQSRQVTDPNWPRAFMQMVEFARSAGGSATTADSSGRTSRRHRLCDE